MRIINLSRASEYVRGLYPPPLYAAGDILSVAEIDRIAAYIYDELYHLTRFITFLRFMSKE